jgi:hypothetical protein
MINLNITHKVERYVDFTLSPKQKTCLFYGNLLKLVVCIYFRVCANWVVENAVYFCYMSCDYEEDIAKSWSEASNTRDVS